MEFVRVLWFVAFWRFYGDITTERPRGPLRFCAATRSEAAQAYLRSTISRQGRGRSVRSRRRSLHDAGGYATELHATHTDVAALQAKRRASHGLPS